jgi:hypothetical protein
MITNASPNVHVYRTVGTSDDQGVVLKRLFQDRELVERENIISINSINWGRIAAQSTYYIYGYLQVRQFNLCDEWWITVRCHYVVYVGIQYPLLNRPPCGFLHSYWSYGKRVLWVSGSTNGGPDRQTPSNLHTITHTTTTTQFERETKKCSRIFIFLCHVHLSTAVF